MAIAALMALLLAMAASAGGGAPSEATFSIRTESGALKSYSLLVKDGAVWLNGISLPDSALVLERQAIALAFTAVESPETRMCAAGLYEHDVMRAGNMRHERGCLEDQRSHALYSAFERLRSSF